MGHSETIHVIGLYTRDANSDNMAYCMNRVEVAQEIEKAKRRGNPIHHLYPQTLTGERILVLGHLDLRHGSSVRTMVTPQEIAHLLPKLVTCRACEGHGCHCCNGSGIARRNNHERWSVSQITDTRAEFELAPLGYTWKTLAERYVEKSRAR